VKKAKLRKAFRSSGMNYKRSKGIRPLRQHDHQDDRHLLRIWAFTQWPRRVPKVGPCYQWTQYRWPCWLGNVHRWTCGYLSYAPGVFYRIFKIFLATGPGLVLRDGGGRTDDDSLASLSASIISW